MGILLKEYYHVSTPSRLLTRHDVLLVGLEPTLRKELDFESSAATNYATGAKSNNCVLIAFEHKRAEFSPRSNSLSFGFNLNLLI